MDRVGFRMRLLPGQAAEYRRRHAAVWPEMLDALRAAGARKYSIFLGGDDLFGYLEVEDFARFRERMAAAEVNDRSPWASQGPRGFRTVAGFPRDITDARSEHPALGDSTNVRSRIRQERQRSAEGGIVGRLSR